MINNVENYLRKNDEPTLSFCEQQLKKSQIKEFFESYWYDNQYLKEKAKEIETMNKVLKVDNNPSLLSYTKNSEESHIGEILNKKNLIENLIQILNQPYKTLMYMKYITFLTFDQIADRMNYSTKRIYQLHSEALMILSEKLNLDFQNVSKS